MKVLVVIGAIALLPMLALAQQPQLPQPRKPGKWRPEGCSANGNYCVPGSDKARPAIAKNGWCVLSGGARVAVIAFAEVRSSRHPCIGGTFK
jgi:hypothetical protein